MSKQNKKGRVFRRDEVENITAYVTKNMLRKDILPKPPTELEILQQKVSFSVNKISAEMKPIIELAKQSDPKSQLSAHHPVGRNQLFVTAHKFAIDEAKKLSHDEALFLLAVEWATKVVEQEV